MTELGKIPPQATELEEGVLGAMLLEDKKAIHLAMKLLKTSHFYKESHQAIFKAIKELHNNSQPIDLLTAMNQLNTDGNLEMVGGALYLSQLTDKVTTTANLEFHARIIIQKSISRDVIRMCSDTISEAYKPDTDVFDLMASVSSQLHDASRNLGGNKAKTLAEIVDELERQLDANQEGVTPGIATGVEKYDSITGGQQKGNLIIYAGRPGMGKSARMCNEAYFQLKQGKAVVIHSLEMTEVEILGRLTALETGVTPEQILKKKVEDTSRIKEGLKWLRKQKLHIFTDRRLENIIVDTHVTQSMYGCDIVYIDYLQLIQTRQKDPFQNVSTASTEMKQLAKSLECPLVALAQLSRAVETRGGDKRPTLSDLRGSGQIEQDADVVEFLYRPEYYEIMSDENGESTQGKCYYINGKMRGGTPGIHITMKWEGAMNRLTSWKDDFQAELPPLPPLEQNNGFDDETPF